MTGTQDARTDGELVAAFLAGDGDALAAIYDRFAAGLYDTARAMLGNADDAADVVQDVFCVAAAKLGQLRERDRVKPWLYAIARHEVFRRSKRRRREAPGLGGSTTDGGWELPAVADPRADGAAVESAELASVVRAAAGGLEARDQLVLELSVRQGLAGEDLAAALGVTLAQSHSLLFRMRDRVERAIGAYVVTRGDRQHCPELATVLAGWDGTFDVLWRKRIARHVDGCDTCTERRRVAVGMAALAPEFVAPAWLRERTLGAAAAATSEPSGYQFGDDGFPVVRRRSSPLGARAAVAATVAVVGGVAIVLALLSGNDPDIVASIDAAPTTTAAPTSTAAPTTTTTTPSTSTTAAAVAPTDPETSTTTVSVAPPTAPTVPRPILDLGAPTIPTTTSTTTTSTTTAPPGPNQPPRVSRAAVTPSTWPACRPPRGTSVSAVATDDSAVQAVSMSWSGPGGSGTAAMSGSTTYSGSFSVSQHVPGTYSVVITAQDGDGATASASTTFTIAAC